MLEELILSGQIRKALEEVHNDKLLPVFIPSYKNREGTIINQLSEIPGDVYLFIYEDDRDNYPKEFPDNVNLHLIKKENFERMNLPWHTIAGKREYMLEYAKNNNFHKVIVIDDDINFEAWIADIKKEVTNKKGKANLWDCFKLITRLSEHYEYGIAGFSAMELSVAHYNWKNVINLRGKPIDAIILNIDNLKKKNIHYQTDCNGLIQEDMGIVIDINANKLKSLQFNFISRITNIPELSKNSIASNKNIARLLSINYYVHYRDYAYLKIKEKNNKEIYISGINFDNIEKGISVIHDEFHEELYKACKDNNLERVKELLTKGIVKEFEEW